MAEILQAEKEDVEGNTTIFTTSKPQRRHHKKTKDANPSLSDVEDRGDDDFKLESTMSRTVPIPTISGSPLSRMPLDIGIGTGNPGVCPHLPAPLSQKTRTCQLGSGYYPGLPQGHRCAGYMG